MSVAVTGHRPDKLGWGYDFLAGKWVALKDEFKSLLVEGAYSDAYEGMALGVDIVFALAVLELKAEGCGIKLHCAIPCKDHTAKWKGLPKCVELYEDILSKADDYTIVTPSLYTPSCMQVRNEYMVDRVCTVIAVWDGSKGGTRNCVKYAQRLDRDIIYIDPKDI